MMRDMVDLDVIKAPRNEGEYIEKVIEIAYCVFDYSSGHREVKMVEAQEAYAGDDS